MRKWASRGVSVAKNLPQRSRHRRHGLGPWVRKVPWRRTWHATPAFLPGESHGQRSLVGSSPGVTERQAGLTEQKLHVRRWLQPSAGDNLPGETEALTVKGGPVHIHTGDTMAALSCVTIATHKARQRGSVTWF